jgi:hypothetical protein
MGLRTLLVGQALSIFNRSNKTRVHDSDCVFFPILGEIRADWRPMWAVVRIEGANGQPGWIDFLANSHCNADDLLHAAKDGLALAGIKETVDLLGLKLVPIDDGRAEQDAKDEEERKRAAMRSGPETGIWRAEDDEIQEQSGHSYGLKFCVM